MTKLLLKTTFSLQSGCRLKEAKQFAADELSPKAVVIFVPYYGVDEEAAVVDELSKYYYVGERQVTKCFYGELAYYQLIRKTSAGIFADTCRRFKWKSSREYHQRERGL